MNANYQADRGRKLFGTGVFLFGYGLIWFHSALPGGIFTRQPLYRFDAAMRACIVLGALLGAYGMLVWRSVSHELSLANYIIVPACACALIVCASEISEWHYFLHRQRGYSLLIDLEVGAIQLTTVFLMVAFGAWWADSAFMRERFRTLLRFSRSAR